MNDEHSALQFRADFFEIGSHVVTVACVVHHHEEHGFLAERLVFSIALFPFLDSERKVVGVFLREQGACALLKFGAAG